VTVGRILVVDDDPVILQLLRVNFELEGYEVLTAEDGETGLARALDGRPEVVVLDVMMPGLTGIEVAERLGAAPDGYRPAVMLLSAKAQTTDVSAGLDVADDYVTKPFDPFELLERVARLLARPAATPDGRGRPAAGGC
jgi:DNA-binding response OmpR family regulator